LIDLLLQDLFRSARRCGNDCVPRFDRIRYCRNSACEAVRREAEEDWGR
jgi:hypothetical protein